MIDRESPALYVGYLPVPRDLVGWLRITVPALLWGLCAVAALLGGSMGNAGSGSWNTSDARVFEGELRVRPYPCVHVVGDDASRPARTILLVESGKVGARAGFASLDGARVKVEGFVLEREGRMMLELLPGDEGVREIGPPDAVTKSEQVDSVGEVTLRGEIVDSKCWYGAMKPGNGLRHRACARLCVSGGIPPALVVPTAQGDRCYLLAAGDGGPANHEVLNSIALPVEVRGVLTRMGDLFVIRLAQHGVRPLVRE